MLSRQSTPAHLTMAQRDAYLDIQVFSEEYQLNEVEGFHNWRGTLADDYANLCKVTLEHDERMGLFENFARIYSSVGDLNRPAVIALISPNYEKDDFTEQETCLQKFKNCIRESLSKIDLDWILLSDDNDDIAFLRDFISIGLTGDHWKALKNTMKARGLM